MAFRLRGRDTEIQALRRQLDTVATGRGSVVIVGGLPGMGKSALLAAGTRLAAERGIRVLSGAGDAAAQVVPLGPLLEALVPANDPRQTPAVRFFRAGLTSSFAAVGYGATDYGPGPGERVFDERDWTACGPPPPAPPRPG
jgi:hypothetical protein